MCPPVALSRVLWRDRAAGQLWVGISKNANFQFALAFFWPFSNYSGVCETVTIDYCDQAHSHPLCVQAFVYALLPYVSSVHSHGRRVPRLLRGNSD